MLKDEIFSGDLIELNGVIGKVISADKKGFTFLVKKKYGNDQTYYTWNELEPEPSDEDEE